jgi:hypothetical protein
VTNDLACCAGADSVDIFYFFITSKNLFVGSERVLGCTSLIPGGLCCKEMTVVDLIPGGLGPTGA